jgi:Arc-like DNA binding domain
MVVAGFFYSCFLVVSCSEGAPMSEKTSNQVHVRMPKSLHRKLQREANTHGQTINAEILTRLVQSFSSEKTLDVAARAFTQARGALEQATTALRDELEKRPPQDELRGLQDFIAKSLTHAAERLSDEELQRIKERAEKVIHLINETGRAEK